MDDELIYQRRWWTLLVLCLSLLIVIVGNTALNVAIPTLTKKLGASTTQLQWIVAAYSLVFAGLLLTAGALGDRYGRKGALQLGLGVFAVASTLAAFASSPRQLIAARAVMGAAAAFIMPSTLSILTNTFPPHERARAIAAWAGVAGAGGAIGPIASGWLLEHFSWGSIFFINLPVVALAFLAGIVLVPPSRDPLHAPLDPIGAGLSMVGLASLLYGIIQAPTRGWTDGIILASFAVAAVFLSLFARWELRVRHPMLDLRYFRRRAFTGGCIAITLIFFSMLGLFFLLTQYLQFVLGYSPLGAGARLLPMAATMMVVAPMSARFAERWGTRSVVAAGLLLVAGGAAIMTRAGVVADYFVVALALTVLAGGMALTMAPSTSSIMSSLPMRKAGVGSAVNDTTRELGVALGVAVLGSLLASRYTTLLRPSLGGLPGFARARALSGVGGAIAVAKGIGGDKGAVLAFHARRAFVDGMHSTLLVGSMVALVGAGIVWSILPKRPPSELSDSDLEIVDVRAGGADPVAAAVD